VSRQDEEARFEELFQRCYRAAMALFCRLGFSREEARDWAQETLFRVFKSMKRYRGGGCSYVLQAALNVARNEWRRRAAQERRGGQEIAVEVLPEPSGAEAPWLGRPPAPAPERLEQQEEWDRLRQRLKAALAGLPDSLRSGILLQLQGRSLREIELALNLTQDAVKGRLNEARKRLREALGEKPAGLEWPGPEEDGHDPES
jgi:RNA polymerase sigma factor (sigma-70 family)